MKRKLLLFSLVASLVLYLVDMGTDAYVAIQHYYNDDMDFFLLTIIFIALSLCIVNIYATYVLKAPWYLRALAFLSHFSMIYLFIKEILRLKKESDSNEAYPCSSQKHFSECGCSDCDEQMQKSLKASLNMSHIRSLETFVEAVPQWLLQVYIMVYQQSYPWYTIVSTAISFISLIFSIYSLEKNYWMRRIVESKRNYIRPVSFPKRSAAIFLFWQTFLVFGRLSAIILNIVVFEGSIGILIAAHWAIVVIGLVFMVKRTCNKNEKCYTCGIYSIISFLSLFIIYPLLFHVSHSAVACIKKFLPDKDEIAVNVEALAVALLPWVFAGFYTYGGVRAIKNNGRDELLGWYVAIGCLYAVAFLFEIIFYAWRHPVKVSLSRTAAAQP